MVDRPDRQPQRPIEDVDPGFPPGLFKCLFDSKHHVFEGWKRGGHVQTPRLEQRCKCGMFTYGQVQELLALAEEYDARQRRRSGA